MPLDEKMLQGSKNMLISSYTKNAKIIITRIVTPKVITVIDRLMIFRMISLIHNGSSLCGGDNVTTYVWRHRRLLISSELTVYSIH